MIKRIQQFICGLHGHDRLPQFERDRMFLKCVSCHHETPGWELTEPAAAMNRLLADPLNVRS